MTLGCFCPTSVTMSCVRCTHSTSETVSGPESRLSLNRTAMFAPVRERDAAVRLAALGSGSDLSLGTVPGGARVDVNPSPQTSKLKIPLKHQRIKLVRIRNGKNRDPSTKESTGAGNACTSVWWGVSFEFLRSHSMIECNQFSFVATFCDAFAEQSGGFSLLNTFLLMTFGLA